LWYQVGNQLKNRKSGKCLSVSGSGSAANGAELIQWSCNGGLEQMWTPSDGYLVNHNSGKVASIAGASFDKGAKVIQWSANGGNEQVWQFIARVIDA
ncbi:MAG: RICIN domain-containing protein, partial [Umezawaea sp.]